MLWGSNAREVHPIFFHHVLKGIRRGARLYAVDPRHTSSAQWADAWLGIDVGSDISLANAIGREIIEAGLVNETFVARATTGYDVPFATKPQLARQMIERAVHAGVPFPGWPGTRSTAAIRGCANGWRRRRSATCWPWPAMR